MTKKVVFKTSVFIHILEDNLEHLASGLTEAEKYQRGLGHEANEDDELDPEEMALASFGGGTFNADEEGVGGKRLTK
jgi:hypothetical protein